MPFSPGLVDFIQAAVRLPHDRLSEIRQQWEEMQSERTFLAHMVGSDRALRREMDQLKSYIVTAAVQARAESKSQGSMTDQEVAEIIFPAVESVFIRSKLEYSADSAKATLFRSLTKPFEDILSPTI